MSTLAHNGSDLPPLPRIELLPDVVIDQIAAGEVLERPANAVKELVDNSLDAGATRIEVNLRDGGLAELLIHDNGHGILREDLPKAVLRHATSKIRKFSDLDRLASYGFRGEALASLAAVSHLTIQSCVRGYEGAEIEIVHGEVLGIRPSACPPGTTIRVKDFFAKLPARQKFLKTASTEFSHAARLLREIALVNVATRFSLTHQGKRVAEYVAERPEARFLECFRPNAAPFVVEEETEGMRIQAFLSPPELLSDRCDLWVYVNRRPVRHRSILTAVRQAYQGVLGPHHEPCGALFLELLPCWVDPNAHPQKTEVRLQKEQAIYAWLTTVVRRALERGLPGSGANREGRYSSPTKQPPKVSEAKLSEVSSAHSVVDSKYWWVHHRDAVAVIDRTALMRWIFCHDWSRQLQAQGKIDSLAIRPTILGAPATALEHFGSKRDLWITMGFDLEPFGEKDVILRSVPICLATCSFDLIFSRLLICLRDPYLDQFPEDEALVQKVGQALAPLAPVLPSIDDLPIEIGRAVCEHDQAIFGWRSPDNRRVVVRWDAEAVENWFVNP